MAIGESHQKIVGIKNEIQSLSVTEQQMLNDKLGTNVLALVEEALTATDVASVRPRGVVVDRFNKSVAMTQAKQDVELSNASTGMTGFSLPGQFTQPTSQAVDIENLYPSSEYEFISYTNPQGMSVMIALDQKGMITARMLSVEPSQWRTLQQQRVFPLFISE